jgi:23S rRNA pseudouridine1911/1915/1917 synthase
VSPRYSFTVPDHLAGSRLDRCLTALEERWTRSGVRRLIDDGRVLLNDRQAKPATPVGTGDRIEVDEPPPRRLDLEPQPIPLHVLHEDRDLLVINKQAGLVIHPASGHGTGTLVNALLSHCDDLSGIGGAERPGIVHRLDQDTTGALVVAKSERAHLGLALAFRRRQVEKTYFAVCYGVPKDAEGVIDGPIGRHPRERQRMAVVPSGRVARTLYSVQEEFHGTVRVECRPITGRTHQIRVHLAHAGHAIVGDPVYAGRQWRSLAREDDRTGCREFPRQALHAWRLAFDHPGTGERMKFEAPLPDDIQRLLEILRRTE